MAEINIPTGPIDRDPYGAIRPTGEETVDEANAAALRDALRGIELGAADKDCLDWLSDRPTATVAVICSLIGRARNAPIEGRIVLDEVEEMGITDDEWGRDVLWLEGDTVILNAHGPYYMDADEAEEWAAHLATMARALRAAKAGGEA